MGYTVLRLVLAIGVATGLAVKPQAQEPSGQKRETFRSTVDLVTVQASVKDSHGRIVNGLTTNDFEVRDNGQLRPILSLRSDRQSPLSLAILVDMSGSMRVGSRIALARQAYEAILAQLQQDRDEMAVFTFDSSLHDRRDFTRDLASLRDALSEFEPFGTTSLYDATAATARQLAARSATHKAIIVLTDGIDNSSHMTAREVSAVASSIDVPVFVVATVPWLDQRFMLDAMERGTPSDSADLRDLAEWTGGQVVLADDVRRDGPGLDASHRRAAPAIRARDRSGERRRVATARRQGQTSVDGRQSPQRILRRLDPLVFFVSSMLRAVVKLLSIPVGGHVASTHAPTLLSSHVSPALSRESRTQRSPSIRARARRAAPRDCAVSSRTRKLRYRLRGGRACDPA